MSTTPTAEALFAEYDRHPGDREAPLAAVASWRPFERVLYAGSYIDIRRRSSSRTSPTWTQIAVRPASLPIGTPSTA